MRPEFIGLLVLSSLIAIWWLEILPPLGAALVIRIRAGRLVAVAGSVRTQTLADLAEVLRPVGLTRGFLAINDRRRIIFSRNIPAPLHQQLRNILANR
jgi:hypothetical protein